jgi:hypothetical protein
VRNSIRLVALEFVVDVVAQHLVPKSLDQIVDLFLDDWNISP